jgi:hypothetical protein
MLFPTSKGVDYMLVHCYAPMSDESADYFWITSLLQWLRYYGFFYTKFLRPVFPCFSFLLLTCDMVTTGPSCEHLMYAYKLTTCSFVCMGTGEAGPSSLL